MSEFENIKRGLEEAIAYERGELKARKVRVTVAPPETWSAEAVRDVRVKSGMTQRVFASVLGVNIKTVEAWEAGRNTPAGPASRMLTMLKRDPSLPEKMRFLYRA